MDLTTDKVSVNNNLTMLQNYTAYDVAVISNRNFRSGGFTSKLLPTINGIYDGEGMMRWLDYLDSLKVFLHDKKYKYLKSINGELIKIISEGSGSTFDYKYIDTFSVGKDYGNSNQPVDVSIYWTEIGSV